MLLFAFSVTALLFFTYWNTRRTLDDTDRPDHRGRDHRPVDEEYQHFGLPGLVETCARAPCTRAGALPAVGHPAHHYVAGNLAFWPQDVRDPRVSMFVEFDYERPVDGKLEDAPRARPHLLRLPGDFVLLVAQDVHDRYLTERMFTTTLPWTVLLILVLGTGGGALMSRNMLRRLDAINRTSGRDHQAGDLTRRVPLAGSGDEFDTLAENLNRMLDRIERLMKGLREVTDSVAHDSAHAAEPPAQPAGGIGGAAEGLRMRKWGPARSSAPSPRPTS